MIEPGDRVGEFCAQILDVADDEIALASAGISLRTPGSSARNRADRRPAS